MKKVALIIWDEAFMIHHHGFEAVARTLQHLRENNTGAFAGVTIVVLGDLRQTLPVMPKGSRSQIVDACLTQSELWKSCKRLILTQNMRVLTADVGDREELLNYCRFLLDLGDGKMPTDKSGCVQIPEQFLLPANDTQGVLQWVYGDRPEPLPEKGSCSEEKYLRILKENTDYFQDKAILCPKNADVDKLNEEIISSLPGEPQIYRSADSVTIH